MANVHRTFKDILSELALFYRFKYGGKTVADDAFLADKLGISVDALVKRRQRDSVPYKLIIDLCLSENICVNDLFCVTGKRLDYSIAYK